MKRILSVFTVAAFVACNSNPKAGDTTTVPAQDTVGMAAYQQWKAQNELANTQQNTAVAAPVTHSSATTKRSTSTKRTSSGSSNSGSMSSSSSNTAKASEKKGWSKTAKGAVIGGVAGAAGGAVINKKNRGAGAVIG